jgi:hypothetical protein
VIENNPWRNRMKTSRILLISIALLVIAYVSLRKEGFTSPGTMVQLASSHVPTAEDYNYYKNIYPKVVRRDIADMTGSDPGPISGPLPQLWL